jgi:hypothetical protein
VIGGAVAVTYLTCRFFEAGYHFIMRLFVCCLLLAACAQRTPAPVADPDGPHTATEKITAHGGPLKLDAWPQNGVEVHGDKVYVWVFLEGADADSLTETARAQAAADLSKFVDTATQQLDLQLQAVGQEPASSSESDAIRARFAKDVVLGDGERAWQNVQREDQAFCRVFLRYTVSFGSLVSLIEAALGERPHKADIARKVIASFDPDAR